MEDAFGRGESSNEDFINEQMLEQNINLFESNEKDSSKDKSQLFYNNSLENKNIINNNKNKKEEISSLNNNSSSSLINENSHIMQIINDVIKKIDEIIDKLNNFKTTSKSLLDTIAEQTMKVNSNINNKSSKIEINDETRLEIKYNEKNQNTNTNSETFDSLKNISDNVEKLENYINTNFEYIKTKMGKINNDTKKEVINIINLDNSEQNKNNIKESSYKKYIIEQNILVPKAESHFGLDNQFEFIEYNLNNNLLIHINNMNNLELKLISKQTNEIITTLIIQNIFPDDIREIRYYSKLFQSDENNESKIHNYLLVSSQKNELKIFEVFLDADDFETTLKEKNHINNIYQKPNNYISQDFFDLSSCILRLNESDILESEIFTTCWEGNSIRVYSLLQNKFKTEIISKKSCNIKYCEIFDDKYLLFCGCNKQDNYTCANRIDFENIDYSKNKNDQINFIKYRDECPENRENVNFHLFLFHNNKNNNKFLFTCDEKGFLRMFNFENQELIYKIFPSKMNIKFIYDEENLKQKRLNSIIEWKNNKFLVTERKTGYVFIIELNLDQKEKLKVDDCFNLFEKEIISIRKFKSNAFLALGEDIKDIENIERIRLVKIFNNN